MKKKSLQEEIWEKQTWRQAVEEIRAEVNLLHTLYDILRKEQIKQSPELSKIKNDFLIKMKNEGKLINNEYIIVSEEDIKNSATH